MAKEEPPKDWADTYNTINEKGVRDQAKIYIKHFKKTSQDTFFDGRPIDSPNRLIARSIIALIDDRTDADLLDHSEVIRRDLTDIAVSIIEQVQASKVEDSLYERLVIVDGEPIAAVDLRVDALLDEAEHYHIIAEVWASKPDLTTLEACHGVAREAYSVRFQGDVQQPEPHGAFDPHRVYDKMYDTKHEDQIKARTMRAAKDLFGGT